MLKTLRTKTRRVMLVTLILVIPSFVLYFGWQSIRGKDDFMGQMERARFRPPDAFRKAAGRGGWVSLSGAELYAAQRQMFQGLGRVYGENFLRTVGRDLDEDAMFPVRDLIHHAMGEWYLDRLADQWGITVSDDELIRIIENAFAGVPLELREQVLWTQGLTVPEFERNLRSMARREQAGQFIYSQCRPLHPQLWEAYLVEREELRMDYAVFRAEEYIAQVEPTDALLETFFQENGEKFRQPDQRRYRYALLSKASLEKEIEVSPEEIRKFYEENKDPQYIHGRDVQVRQILIPLDFKPEMSDQERDDLTSQTLRRAQLVYAQAAEAEDFGRFADEFYAGAGYTSATLSRIFCTPGGKIEGWIAPERSPELGRAFVLAALQLEKGRVSPPVRIMYPGNEPFTYPEGFSIIKCEEVREPGVLPFEEVADRAARDSFEAKRERLFLEREKDLRSEVFHYTTIESLARAKGMEEGLTTWVLTDTSFLASNLFADRADLDYLKSDLRQGEMSALLRTATGDAVFVLHLEEEKPSHIPADFREVRAQVEAAYINEKSIELAQKHAAEFLGTLTPDDFLTTDSPKLENRFQTTDWFSRFEHSMQFPEPLMDFIPDTFLATTHTMGLSAMGMDENFRIGYMAWHVRAIKSPSREAFLQDLPIMERNAVFAEREGLLNEWLWDLRSMSVIEERTPGRVE